MVGRVLATEGGPAGWRPGRGLAKKMRPADTAPGKTQRPVATGPVQVFGQPMRKEEQAQGKTDDGFANLEDQDIDDELSFLVDKCDLDAERKQAMFMPYIT